MPEVDFMPSSGLLKFRETSKSDVLIYFDSLTDCGLRFDDMPWASAKYTKTQIDKAGRDLTSGDAEIESAALPIVESWRRAHYVPMNIFHAVLRRRAQKIDPYFISAQRLKRMSSIREKLKRASTRLSQMHDLGGCRAVVQTLDEVKELVKVYADEDAARPMKQRGHLKDYIEKPQKTGYRGIHLIYKYFGQHEDFHGLNIELQIRTNSQHAWATAVETVGIFTKTALKSSKGSRNWLRFFAVMGTAIAEMEGCQRVPNTPPLADIKQVLLDYINDLNALGALRTFGSAIHVASDYDLKNDKFVLLNLIPGTRELAVWGYRKEQLRKAYEDYAAIENKIQGSGQMVVLVTVSAISELRRAYPNYFLDTSAFVELVEKAIGV